MTGLLAKEFSIAYRPWPMCTPEAREPYLPHATVWHHERPQRWWGSKSPPPAPQ